MKPFGLGLVVVALIASLDPALADLANGSILSVSGNVTLIDANGVTQPVNSRSKIPIGSTLQSGADGQLVIHWMKGVDSVVSKGTKLSLVALDDSKNKGAANRQIVLRLESGSLYDQVNEASGSSSELVVKTLSGSYVSKGQGSRHRLTVNTDDDEGMYQYRNEMSVESGAVEANLNNGSSVLLTQGQQGHLSLDSPTRFTNSSPSDSIWNDIVWQVDGLQAPASQNIVDTLSLVSPKPLNLGSTNGAGAAPFLSTPPLSNDSDFQSSSPQSSGGFSSSAVSQMMNPTTRYATPMAESQ